MPIDLSLLANLANVIAVLVAIMGVVVMVWQSGRAMTKRRLGYEFYPIASPIHTGAKEAVEGDLEIRYKGRVIENLFILQIKLKNMGTSAIRGEHVSRPITFTFDAGTELLAQPRIVYTNPPDLKIALKSPKRVSDSIPKVVSIDFDLLNEDDQFSIEFVWTGPRTGPKISGHIESCTIDPIDHGKPSGQVFSAMVVAFFLLVFGLGTLCATVNPFGMADIYRGISAGFVLASVLGLALRTIVWQLGKYSNRVARKRLKTQAKING
jgi:hypothetical protein